MYSFSPQEGVGLMYISSCTWPSVPRVFQLLPGVRAFQWVLAKVILRSSRREINLQLGATACVQQICLWMWWRNVESLKAWDWWKPTHMRCMYINRMKQGLWQHVYTIFSLVIVGLTNDVKPTSDQNQLTATGYFLTRTVINCIQ
jgi:hypothetical protein